MSEEAAIQTDPSVRGQGSLSDWGEPVQRLAGRNWTKASILRCTRDGREWAVKEYSQGSSWQRRVLGRWLLGRERRALRHLQGQPGIPELYGAADPLWIATRWICGTRLSEVQLSAELAARAEASLRARVEALHVQGVAHGDLHGRDVLVDEKGEVYLVDFATSLIKPTGFAPIQSRIYSRWLEQDEVAVERLCARLRGHSAEKALSSLAPAKQRRYLRARRWKRWWDRLRK